MSESERAERIPLPGLLDPLLAHIRRGVVGVAHAAGFTDIREAHNTVFGLVPADGIRLTDLAARAGVSKQAMSELVNDLVEKGYFSKEPDPTDGRAKLICWSERAWEVNTHAQQYFDDLERELAALVGTTALGQLRRTLEVIVTSERVQR